MYAVEVVADDLTGAMDTSQGFAARGYATTVVADPEAKMDEIEQGAAVLGINTNSRYDSEADAIDAVSTAVGAISSQTIYKKVDSTLRGNFAGEVDAALSVSGAELALVAPAFPSAGRTTEDGVHYVKGAPVAETEYGDDKKGPTSSSLVDLFKSIDRPVDNIPLSTLKGGHDEVATAVTDIVERSSQAPIIICDAVEDTHLATAAEATTDVNALYVGSAGLAEQITVSGANADTHSSVQLLDGAALGIAGSVSKITLEQLDHVSNDVFIQIDGSTLLNGNDLDNIVEQAVQRLRDNQPVVLTAATAAEDVDQTLAVGEEQGLTSSEIREQIATGLATIAAAVLQDETPSGLLLTGGDIAVAVIRELEATAVTLTGEEVEAGIPIGTFADGATSGMPLITKAGGFGSEEAIVNCLDVLSQTDA
ncbi:four-carbon acid sugar kinase family protein [Natrinema soli]|uniref:Four-carbon acid sugar kinase family protein n=1 Tax=Natrinema soli TaxID=1930624 RepID=A0ABD5SIX6_9EURY|nr:four-carbon acid sugar kinase family protein [Natrinema soli]